MTTDKSKRKLVAVVHADVKETILQLVDALNAKEGRLGNSAI